MDTTKDDELYKNGLKPLSTWGFLVESSVLSKRKSTNNLFRG